MPSMMKKAYYIISPEIVEHKKKHIYDFKRCNSRSWFRTGTKSIFAL